MQFQERDEGDFRIYAGALEAPRGNGFVASVIVNRMAPAHERREVFRDVSMFGGHRWLTSDDALRQAVKKGREIVRGEPCRLGRHAS